MVKLLFLFLLILNHFCLKRNKKNAAAQTSIDIIYNLIINNDEECEKYKALIDGKVVKTILGENTKIAELCKLNCQNISFKNIIGEILNINKQQKDNCVKTFIKRLTEESNAWHNCERLLSPKMF